MVPPKPVNGALIPATASQSSSPHSTCEDGQIGQAITSQQAAAHCRTQARDTSAVLTPQATFSGGHSGTSQNMLFSDLYKSTKLPLSRLRQHSPQPVPVSRDYDPDLVSKDKAKQKEAVRRFLSERIRNDWVFKWPPESEAKDLGKAASEDLIEQVQSSAIQQPAIGEVKETDEHGPGVDDDGYHCDDDGDDDAASIYSTVSEDPVHFCPRAEWLSDLSDEENDEPASPLAYRFETPDAVGSTVKATALARSAKRRRAARAEMEWNPGLACFAARRDAWTGAKVVRVRPKPIDSAPTSPTTKRLSFWRLSTSSSPSSPIDSLAESTTGTAPLSPSGTRYSGETTALSSVDTEPKRAQGQRGYVSISGSNPVTKYPHHYSQPRIRCALPSSPPATPQFMTKLSSML
ncbi:hypothetical protein NUW58_g2822 [Xylaria curta]|uniref:Uncharacterized protein n=1 Tax=Xylaria curta TaxID=42375 RepID=A0ACC1PDR0_9PEZI|nr:hypothetical protein NUW58_g2822 [Xylaria curta]